jgi:hypothetical protein
MFSRTFGIRMRSWEMDCSITVNNREVGADGTGKGLVMAHTKMNGSL